MSDPPDDRFGLPPGSVVPSADIWDDDDDWQPGDDDPSDADDPAWLVEAQRVVHDSDDSEVGADSDEALAAEAVAAGAGLAEDPTFDGRSDEAIASRIARWSRTSMVGASIAGMGLGLQKIFDPKDPVQIEIQVDDDLDDPLDPVEVKLDRDHPELSTATVRPWLFGKPRSFDN